MLPRADKFQPVHRYFSVIRPFLVLFGCAVFLVSLFGYIRDPGALDMTAAFAFKSPKPIGPPIYPFFVAASIVISSLYPNWISTGLAFLLSLPLLLTAIFSLWIASHPGNSVSPVILMFAVLYPVWLFSVIAEVACGCFERSAAMAWEVTTVQNNGRRKS